MYSKLTALVEHSEIVGQKSFRRTWNNKNIQKVKVSSSDLHRKQREMVRCRRGTPGSSGPGGHGPCRQILLAIQCIFTPLHDAVV